LPARRPSALVRPRSPRAKTTGWCFAPRWSEIVAEIVSNCVRLPWQILSLQATATRLHGRSKIYIERAKSFHATRCCRRDCPAFRLRPASGHAPRPVDEVIRYKVRNACKHNDLEPLQSLAIVSGEQRILNPSLAGSMLLAPALTLRLNRAPAPPGPKRAAGDWPGLDGNRAELCPCAVQNFVTEPMATMLDGRSKISTARAKSSRETRRCRSNCGPHAPAVQTKKCKGSSANCARYKRRQTSRKILKSLGFCASLRGL
jgi:hypothetical protein